MGLAAEMLWQHYFFTYNILWSLIIDIAASMRLTYHKLNVPLLLPPTKPNEIWLRFSYSTTLFEKAVDANSNIKFGNL